MRPEDYEKNHVSTLETLQYIEAHPYRATFKKMLPGFIRRHLNGTRNSTVLELATHLHLMGLGDELPEITKTLEKSEESTNETTLGNFQKALYLLFNDVSTHATIKKHHDTIKALQAKINVDPSADHSKDKEEIAALEKIIESHNANLKQLKKLIHQFARENDFECRLFKASKLTKKGLPFSYGYDPLELENTSKRLEFEQQKYIYIPDGFEDEIEKAENERKIKRKIKSRLNIASFLISLVVGIGEGLVAAVFAAAIWPLTLTLFVIGIPAFLCNYYLFRRDSFSILKDIFFGKIWKKPNGKTLSRTEKIFVGTSLLFSFGAAAAFGFLSFGAAITGLGLIGLAANPIGLIIVAGFVAIVTAAALFTIFTYMTVNWVRNGGPGKLKNIILNLKNSFINFCKHEDWSKPSFTFKNKAAHVANRILTAFRNTISAVIAVAAVVLANIAITGQFKHKADLIFRTVFKACDKVSNILSYVLIVGLGAIVNSIFYGRGVIKVLNTIKSIATNTVSAIVHPQVTWRKIKKSWKSIKSSPIRLVHHVVSFFKRAFLLACVAMNAFGQSNGVRHDPTARSYAHSAAPVVNPSTDSHIASYLAFGGSAGPNGDAVIKATKVPEPTPSADNSDANPNRRQQTPASASNPCRLMSAASSSSNNARGLEMTSTTTPAPHQ